jgi:hypothetical protein
MTSVLVCGGRDYIDVDRVYGVLDTLHAERHFSMLIHGAARGADSLAASWAKLFPEIKIVPFPADWHTYGNAAGPIRNRQMLREGKPDLVVAFPGGTGTADMVKIARSAGVEIISV